VEVIDESAAPGESTLYSDIESGRTGETAIEDDFLVFSKSIDIGQRAWRVSCSSTASYLDMRRSNYPIIMLGVILALTTLLAGYLILNYRRTWKIELLVEERKIAEELATKSLAEKEVLLKETHHRVKNNLQIISSLLNLQSAQIEDEAAQKLFTESKDRVSAMALIHEKLYRSEDLAEVDFGDYLESLIENLSQSYTLPGQPVTIDMAAQDISLDIDTAIPCALIINELVSNGLKHAFPIDAPSGNGENVIQVAMTHEGVNELVLRVSDNGCGFSDGVNFRDTESLGFQIVTTLTEQLDGVIDLNNEDGTTFTLRLNENLENAGV
jgi:two-component sensor histidine kinase